MSRIDDVARAILKARFYDPEPEMYGNDLERFYAELDPELMAEARFEARAAMDVMEPENAALRGALAMSVRLTEHMIWKQVEGQACG